MNPPSLAAAALSRTFQLPSPELPPGRFVELPGRGTTFAAEIPGPPGAPTVLLLHGLACTGYLNWFPALPELGRRYRVVMLDQRGHGRGIEGWRFFRLRDCAEDVVALADALGIDRFIPVGYSMGGAVAQLVWRHHPDRVDGLVLCATARNFRGKPREQLFFRMLPLVAWAMALRRPAGHVTGELGRELAGLPPSTGLADLDLPRWALDEVRMTSWWTVVQAVNAIGQFSSHRWISRVDVPSAVVVTANDTFVPPGRQVKLAHAIPGATVHPLRGNHAACVLESRRFVPALLEALESVTSRLTSR